MNSEIETQVVGGCAEDVLARNGLPGATELFVLFRAAVLHIESLAEEKAAIMALMSETEQRIEARQQDVAAAAARAEAEIAKLALASDNCPLEKLESEEAAEALARQVGFLRARLVGLREKLQGPIRELALAAAELQTVWDQLRERQLDQIVAEFCAAALQMKRAKFKVLGICAAFPRRVDADGVSGRLNIAEWNILEASVLNPATGLELISKGVDTSWPKDPQAADLHRVGRELAASVKSALQLARGKVANNG